MGKLLVKTNLKRKPNMLYYVKEVDGYLGVWEAELQRNGKKKVKKRG
jgi:hypothetical protein